GAQGCHTTIPELDEEAAPFDDERCRCGKVYTIGNIFEYQIEEESNRNSPAVENIEGLLGSNSSLTYCFQEKQTSPANSDDAAFADPDAIPKNHLPTIQISPFVGNEGNPRYPVKMRLPGQILGLLPMPETGSDSQSTEDGSAVSRNIWQFSGRTGIHELQYRRYHTLMKIASNPTSVHFPMHHMTLSHWWSSMHICAYLASSPAISNVLERVSCWDKPIQKRPGSFIVSSVVIDSAARRYPQVLPRNRNYYPTLLSCDLYA
ncbi:hypothetical protein PABG_01573, partial [Paracoccidioides brasiliensis Pb03]